LPWFSQQPISEESKRKILWDNAVKLYGPRLLGWLQPGFRSWDQQKARGTISPQRRRWVPASPNSSTRAALRWCLSLTATA